MVISIGTIASAGGASSYYASDNYYAGPDEAPESEWIGKGAEALGLSGPVTEETLKAILEGKLPDDSRVGHEGNHRPGFDITASLPKGASIAHLVGGDERIAAAHKAAVKEAFALVIEKHAEARVWNPDTKTRHIERTGNVVAALIPHDTSRSLDPQTHTHIVIANMTQTADGTWRALWNGEIHQRNAEIGAAYHAIMRNKMEELGYQTQIVGKHGAWDIVGVPQTVKTEFSQRRQEILSKIDEKGYATAGGRLAATLETRDRKHEPADRGTLYQDWQERARAHGFDAKAFVAEIRAHAADKTAAPGFTERALELVSQLRERLKHSLALSGDPLHDPALGSLLKAPEAHKAEFAVASAIRMLSEREAAFDRGQIMSAALNFAVNGLNPRAVIARIDSLIEKGALIPEKTSPNHPVSTLVTTPAALRTETRILEQIDAGRSASRSVVGGVEAAARLEAVSADRPLNTGQLAAGVAILSADDRITAIQGNAGTGKSTLVNAVARALEGDGKQMIGLAFQNKMVADLRSGAGIEAHTIASFLGRNYHAALSDGPQADALRKEMANTTLVVDESSMVSSRDMLRLTTFANAVGVERLVLMGDRQQLSSIEAGKSFAMVQAAGIRIDYMTQNLRQKTDELKAVAALATHRQIGAAFAVLGDRVVENRDPAAEVARRWLAMDAASRDNTAIFTSGRALRADINTSIQEGLRAEGTISGEGLNLTILTSANLSREEMRYASSYQTGQVLEAKTFVRELALSKGHYSVDRVKHNGEVLLRDERNRFHSIDPRKIDPRNENDRLGLHTKTDITVHDGDKIRLTANDKDRRDQGLQNATIASVLKADKTGVEILTHTGDVVKLGTSDPMLQRIDLAYALNMHMAQGVTSPAAIIAMDASEKYLANTRLFTVGVTRVESDLTLVTNDRDRLAAQISRTTGDKMSGLEITGAMHIDDKGTPRFEKFEIPRDDRALIIARALDPATGPGKGAAVPSPANDTPAREPVPEKKIDIGLA